MDTPELKDTNPKDAIGSTKLPLHLVPDSAMAYLALSFCEGATKYGAFNWRVAGVRASIYMSAARRHMAKFWNGEWADPKTNVPHLASAMACMAIILDAKLVGKLTDDRPPAAPMGGLIDGMAEIVQHLQELHKDLEPLHWTIADSDPKSRPSHIMFMNSESNKEISFYTDADGWVNHHRGSPMPDEIRGKRLIVRTVNGWEATPGQARLAEEWDWSPDPLRPTRDIIGWKWVDCP